MYRTYWYFYYFVRAITLNLYVHGTCKVLISGDCQATVVESRKSRKCFAATTKNGQLLTTKNGGVQTTVPSLVHDQSTLIEALLHQLL